MLQEGCDKNDKESEQAVTKIAKEQSEGLASNVAVNEKVSIKPMASLKSTTVHVLCFNKSFVKISTKIQIYAIIYFLL